MKRRCFSLFLVSLLTAAFLVLAIVPAGKALADSDGKPGFPNEEFFLTPVEGTDEVSTKSNPGQTTVLVFGSTQCGNTAGELREIGNSSWVKNQDIRVIFAECNYASAAVTKSFAANCGVSGSITSCYDDTEFSYMNKNLIAWDYYAELYKLSSGSLPFTVFIDGENRVRNVLTGRQSAASIKSEIDKISSGSSENKPEPTPTEKPTESKPEPTPTEKPTESKPEPTPTEKPTENEPSATPTPKPTQIPEPPKEPYQGPAVEGPINLSVQGTENYAYAADILKLVNQTRAEKGLPALSLDKDLTETAMQRAAELSVYYSHTRPDGNSCFTATSRGTYRAENIAIGYPSPSTVMAAWNSSAGHYANIMSESATSIGVGCFKDSEGVWHWVQFFDNDPAVEPTKTGSIQVTRTVSVQKSNVQLKTRGSQSFPCSKQNESFSMEIYNVNVEFGASRPEMPSSNFLYMSSNLSVATVNSKGVVTMKDSGTVTITAFLKEDPSISVSQEFTLTEHSYTTQMIEPTLTAPGYILYTCSVCQHSYQDVFLPALSETEAEHASGY